MPPPGGLFVRCPYTNAYVTNTPQLPESSSCKEAANKEAVRSRTLRFRRMPMKYALYGLLTVLLHLPFDCPLALLPFIGPDEQAEVITA